MVAIAYTDPTFLPRRMANWTPVALPTPVPVDANLMVRGACFMTPIAQPNYDLCVVTLPNKEVPFTFTPMIPTPPMGKLSVITFPAIYKEKGDTRPQEGQVWPRYNRTTL